MALQPSTRLGPYEIVSSIGAGGMGEVYRARDTRLDRTVAIKVLPEHLSNPQLRERFEREAKAISSLSHPHICPLYDVGHQDGIDFLVMEYLEGETLADRLAKGPLPLEQVLKYGIEICGGLERAHHTGVVHRDLKPGNIMLTKAGAKLMDFGLAKVVSPLGSLASGSTATLSTPPGSQPLTAQGTIVGTFQYMSPEQVEGKESDVRSDIFSLGAVLYQMATGRIAFEGKTAASLIAAILERDPAPISDVKPMTPPALERAVKTCMVKDPDERFQSVHDLKLQLKWIADGGSGSASQTGILASAAVSRKNPTRIAWATAAILGIVAAVFAAMHFQSHNQTIMRTQIGAPGKVQFKFMGDLAGPPAISPDGSHIVFSGNSEGNNQLYLRPLDSMSTQPLPGTEDASFPFWSPDSRSIAFFTGGKLKRIEVAGGPPATICDAPNSRGGTWGSSGVIVFTPNFNTGLFRVPASGGTPVETVKLNFPKYTTYRWPWFLPDGKHFLYLAANHNSPSGPDTGVFFASLDGKENRLLFLNQSNAIYASGYLLFLRKSTLLAQPFDPSAGRLHGDLSVLDDDVQYDSSVWRETVALSENGVLLYEPGQKVTGQRVAWFDRGGKQLSNIADQDTYGQVQLSPDGKRLALSIGDPLSTIWVYDLNSDLKTRLTFGSDVSYSDLAWSPDGALIAYTASSQAGLPKASIFSKSSVGAGEQKQLLGSTPGVAQTISDWSPDGRWILYTRGASGVGPDGMDIWVLPLTGGQMPFPYATGPGDQQQGQFSPDGRYVAYASNETGRPEVYIAPFPWTGAKWQVSTNGGGLPRWRHDSRELFFDVVDNGQIMAAEIKAGAKSIEVGQAVPLFRIRFRSSGTPYTVSRDGQRFVAISSGEEQSFPLTLVQNWTAGMEKR